jgi:hypothetical protein
MSQLPSLRLSRTIGWTIKVLRRRVSVSPLLGHSLSLQNLSRRHLSFCIEKIYLRAGPAEPHVRVNKVFWNSQTIQIEKAQIVSTLACAAEVWNVLGGFTVPLSSHNVVLLHSLSIFVHLFKADLSIWVALRGTLPRPFQRLLKISFSKSPLLIKCAKPHLCVFVPELCASQELLARILWPDFIYALLQKIRQPQVFNETTCLVNVRIWKNGFTRKWRTSLAEQSLL